MASSSTWVNINKRFNPEDKVTCSKLTRLILKQQAEAAESMYN